MGKKQTKKSLNDIISSRITATVLTITCILVLAALLSIAVLTSENATASLEIAATYSQQLLEQILAEAENVNALVQMDSDVQNMLRNVYTDKTDAYKQRLDINGIISMLQHNYVQNIDAFYILLDDGRAFKSTNFPLLKNNFTDENWYKSLRAKDEIQWLKPYEHSLTANNRKTGYVAVSFPLYNVRTGLSSGVVLVEIRTSTFETILRNGLVMEKSDVSICDSTGKKIVSIYDTETAETSIEKQIGLTNGWSVVYSCEILALIWIKMRALCGIFVLLVVFTILISKSTSKRTADRITEPIGELLTQMDAYNADSNDIVVRIPSDISEIDTLFHKYNSLIERIQELFTELEKQEKEIKRSEFAALQAQINPHFLYNTMDTIAWLIRKGQSENALKTLIAFSQYFRISLSKGANMLPVRLELKHAELYLDIQKMRFGGDFSFEIINCIPISDCDNIYVPKLILQPLIENSIIHGIQAKIGPGEIKITARCVSDTLEFTVHDNGNGIPEDKLKIINDNISDTTGINPLPEFGSYGLRNVNLRINHVFGPQYGLKLYSVENEFTEAKIIVPINRVPQEE